MENAMSYMDFDDRPELPEEAGDPNAMKFDPDNKWLNGASRELQIEAMRQWFLSRYQDPANDTPYNGREGGYLFIHGGPYDPADEIPHRFIGVVEEDVIDELVDDLISEFGDEWAPVGYEDRYAEWEYEEALSQIEQKVTPLELLEKKLSDIGEILEAPSSAHIKTMTTQLAYGAAIAALEAYLLEVAVWRVLRDDDSLRSFVSRNTDTKLGGSQIKLSAIFEKMDGLKKQVFAYLQTYIWHRLDDVKDIFVDGFGIDFPEVKDLTRDVHVRHDIVHRGGKSRTGEPVTVTSEDVCKVIGRIKTFATELESSFNRKSLE